VGIPEEMDELRIDE